MSDARRPTWLYPGGVGIAGDGAPGWAITADTPESRRVLDAVCARPELRPLLEGVEIVERRRMPVAFQVTDRVFVEMRSDCLASEAGALLTLRHALELVMWRRLLEPRGRPDAAQALAIAALSCHTVFEFLHEQTRETADAALGAAPGWQRRLFEEMSGESAADARVGRVMSAWAELLALQGIEPGRTTIDASVLARARALTVALVPAACPTECLLARGGDSRLLVDTATRLNKYGCSPAPRPHAITFSNCTATSASAPAFAAAESGRRALLAAGLSAGSLVGPFDAAMSHVRQELASLLGIGEIAGAEIVLAASGTDCELLALEMALCAHDGHVTNIVVGPDEIGSGSVVASGGLHFDRMAPLVPEVTCGAPVAGIGSARVHVVELPLRDADGAPVALEDLEAQAESVVAAAAGHDERVLLHLLDGSKTGLRGPSLAAACRIARRYHPAVDVVVDSAQLRTCLAELRRYLDEGFMVIVTGSKFFTGSPFAAALLLPPAIASRLDGCSRFPAGLRVYLSRFELPRRWDRWRDQLTPSLNVGLLTRWHAALQEMRAFVAVSPQAQRSYLARFRDGMLERLGRHDLIALVDAPVGERDASASMRSAHWDAVRTIFTFVVRRPGGPRLTYEEAWDLYCWLNRDMSAHLPAQASEADLALAARACHIGQPVRLPVTGGTAGALRLAVGARYVSRVAFDPALGALPDERIAAQLRDVDTVLAKLTLLLQHWDDVSRSRPATA